MTNCSHGKDSQSCPYHAADTSLGRTDASSKAVVMKPVIKPNRWWWPPDRKKAKLINILQQKCLNMKVQAQYDALKEVRTPTHDRYVLHPDGSITKVTL